MTAAVAVARYTLVELSRRRLLLVFFVIGVVGIAGLGILLKVFSSSFVATTVQGPGYSGPTPEQFARLTELSFVNTLIGVLSVFALLIAFAIGMTAIYHDLESGAAVAIFSKPISRLEFTAGKVLAAVVAMIAIVGALSIEARLVMLLFGGGLEEALWWETLTGVANAVTLMLLVLALSAWMNNIVAAIVAFIYNGAAGVIMTLHQQIQTPGGLGDNHVLQTAINILYWFVPHALISAAPREIIRQEFDIFRSSDVNAPPVDEVLRSVPGPSGATDILWWLFVVAVMACLLYLAVRRRQV